MKPSMLDAVKYVVAVPALWQAIGPAFHQRQPGPEVQFVVARRSLTLGTSVAAPGAQV
jgi:hypothetical protein